MQTRAFNQARKQLNLHDMNTNAKCKDILGGRHGSVQLFSEFTVLCDFCLISAIFKDYNRLAKIEMVNLVNFLE